MIERVENNLLSYGNEMTNNDTPYDCGLGNFCNLDIDYYFIGKTALFKQKKMGFEKDIFKIHFNFEYIILCIYDQIEIQNHLIHLIPQ